MSILKPAQFFQMRQALSLALPQQNGIGAPVDEANSPAMPAPDQAPVGDPVDQIAQILQLDLSAVATPESRNQLVVQAVEDLVLKLHELTGAPESDDGMQDDGQNPDEMQTEQEGGEQEFEGEEDGGEEFEGDDTGEPVEEDGGEEDPYAEEEQQAPPRRKSLAASFAPRVLEAISLSRDQQITNLVAMGKCTPANANKLRQRWCSAESAALVLSMDDDADDGFSNVIAALDSNGPVMVFGERTGAQSKISILDGTGELACSQDGEVNVVAANAAARAEKAKGK